MRKIFVYGSLNMDLVITAPFMPHKGETIIGHSFFTNPGGKGANQAVTCGKLGSPTFMIGAVGNDIYGKEVKTNLEKHQVNVEFVDNVEDAMTGVAVIILSEDDNRIIIDSGANYCIKDNLLSECLDKYANEGDIFVTQLEIPKDKVLTGLMKAKEKGLFTIFNPAPISDLDDIFFKYSDLVVLNETEAAFLSGLDPNKALSETFKYLSKRGINRSIITLGEKGSVAYIDDEFNYVSAVKVQTVDTTAAGDSYVGALATCIAEGKTIFEAMKFASKVSAITVTRKGAQNSIPTRNEVEAFYQMN